MKTLKIFAAIAVFGMATSAGAMSKPPLGGDHWQAKKDHFEQKRESHGQDRGNATDVPAPPMLILFGAAAGALMIRRRRSAKK